MPRRWVARPRMRRAARSARRQRSGDDESRAKSALCGDPLDGLVQSLTMICCASLRRLSVLDVPPPGAGVTTVIGRLPIHERSAERSAARSCVALTNVVGLGAPFA